jgi:hypothetical protein
MIRSRPTFCFSESLWGFTILFRFFLSHVTLQYFAFILALEFAFVTRRWIRYSAFRLSGRARCAVLFFLISRSCSRLLRFQFPLSFFRGLRFQSSLQTVSYLPTLRYSEKLTMFHSLNRPNDIKPSFLSEFRIQTRWKASPHNEAFAANQGEDVSHR